jgi:hypothetical protein
LDIAVARRDVLSRAHRTELHLSPYALEGNPSIHHEVHAVAQRLLDGFDDYGVLVVECILSGDRILGIESHGPEVPDASTRLQSSFQIIEPTLSFSPAIARGDT